MTGLDLAARLLEAGRAKARAEGLDIEWREGDAENLPFEDGSFDRVLSTFGHMFAPRHDRTAQEMARVCRRGGAIVTATWTPEGVFGDLSKAAAPYMPPPPSTLRRRCGAVRITCASCSGRLRPASNSSGT